LNSSTLHVSFVSSPHFKCEASNTIYTTSWCTNFKAFLGKSEKSHSLTCRWRCPLPKCSQKRSVLVHAKALGLHFTRPPAHRLNFLVPTFSAYCVGKRGHQG
jgi:hypothetical protein